MKITVVGSGYVGLVAGACFAEMGNDVICVDIDENKVARLNNGEIPIYEPGLEDLISRNLKSDRMIFTTDLSKGVKESKVIFIAVGTPQDEDGSADLTHVLNVAEGIGKFMNEPKFVVNKSTVPVGTGAKVKAKIEEFTEHKISVISNPEFLKEGAAIDDFMRPDRVVVGVSDEESAQVMKELYAPFVRTNKPILIMDVPSAEITKYAANTMLATRVSFMNEMSLLCEKTGANINDVRIGMGTDARIGMSFLFPGIGYGGSCFPKDVQALVKTGRDYGLELKIATSSEVVNFQQKKVMTEKVLSHFGERGIEGKTFAIWGLAFKPKTDDTREAPALVVIRSLIDLGAKVQCYDPEANETFKARFGEDARVSYYNNSYETTKNADAVIVCTEWNEFRNPNFEKMKTLMKGNVIFDGRNIFNLKDISNKGFVYYSMGRPSIR